MNQEELNKIVDAWIAAEQAQQGSPEHETNWWAVSEVLDWTLEGEGDRLWQFIVEAYQRDVSDRIIGILAAGPVEDLLAKHGPEFIDRIEDLARKDPKFNHLLGGVWRNTINDEVWQRILRIRNHVW
ncbi:MAG TPA: hypothetical protein VFI24_21900 [Pyrinomonadaceae bacterium]|nr:hypothetical protein [Pyrinomonadaceae bacterium]